MKAFDDSGPRQSYSKTNSSTTVDLVAVASVQQKAVAAIMRKAIETPDYIGQEARDKMQLLGKQFSPSVPAYSMEREAKAFDSAVKDYALNVALMNAIGGNDRGAIPAEAGEELRVFTARLLDSKDRLYDSLRALTGGSIDAVNTIRGDIADVVKQEMPARRP